MNYSQHYTIADAPMKAMVHCFRLNEDEAKAVIKYRKKVPVLAEAEDGDTAVDARTLHEQLGVKIKFTDWMRERIKKKRFVEGEDYETIISVNPEKTRGRPRKDYMLTVDTAKNLCMMEDSETGDYVRRYFILCEKLMRGMASYNPPRILSKQNTEKLRTWYSNQPLDWQKKNKANVFFPRFHKMVCQIATGKTPLQWKMADMPNPQNHLQGKHQAHYQNVQDTAVRMVMCGMRLVDIQSLLSDMFPVEEGKEIWQEYTKPALKLVA
ncbi:antA/AntB antirepressor family protein [Endozoicomonadaceae bacterium StTr2]